MTRLGGCVLVRQRPVTVPTVALPVTMIVAVVLGRAAILTVMLRGSWVFRHDWTLLP